MKRTLSIFLVVCIFALGLFGCGSTKEDTQEEVIYTSFYPIYLLTKEVVGDKVPVKVFMPLDKEAHFWEPTAKDIANLSQAKVLFVNGAGMEAWLDKVKESLPELKIVDLSERVPVITEDGLAKRLKTYYLSTLSLQGGKTYTFEFGHTHEKNLEVLFFNEANPKESLILSASKEEKFPVAQKATFEVKNGQAYLLEMAHNDGKISFTLPKDATGEWSLALSEKSDEHLPYTLKVDGESVDFGAGREVQTKEEIEGIMDPHSFISLSNAKAYLAEINTTLSELYPEKKDSFEENKVLAVRNLSKLEHEYKDKFTPFKGKTFIVTHGAFAYLAKDFDLVQKAIQNTNAEDSASLKAIKDTIQFAKEKGIKTVFYELGGDKKGADTVASELGGKALPLDTMEYLPQGRSIDELTYEIIMRGNLETLYQGLEGKS